MKRLILAPNPFSVVDSAMEPTWLGGIQLVFPAEQDSTTGKGDAEGFGQAVQAPKYAD